jgi:hypothetical protein
MTSLTDSLTFSPDAVRYPGRHEVVEAEFAGGGERVPAVVKKVRVTGSRDRAARSWSVAQALVARGIDTPEPLAVGRVGGEGWFVARRLDGAEQIRRWFLVRDGASELSPSIPYGFDEIVGALASLARRLHDSGVFFRDFTDGNVLVTRSEAGPRLWLVDLDRARVGDAPLPLSLRCRDLARPGLNRPEDLKFFLEKYFEPSRVPRLAAWYIPALRRRAVLWDGFKAAVRPWRSRRAPMGYPR